MIIREGGAGSGGRGGAGGGEYHPRRVRSTPGIAGTRHRMSSTHEQAAPGAAGNQPGAQQYVPRPAHARDDQPASRPTGAAFGFTMMAAIMMILSGMWSFLEGLAAVIR